MTDNGTSKIHELELEVLNLETKLRDLHATDAVAEKRALATLRQHVLALKHDTQGLSESLAEMDIDPFSQTVVEEELGALSATALATYVGDRLLKASGALDSKELRGALWTLSLTFVAWRFTFGFWKKFKKKNKRNIVLKANVDDKYKRVQDRINVMADLVPTVPEMETGSPDSS